MSLAGPLQRRDEDPIDQLMDRIHERDVALQCCRDALQSMQTDYEHNLRLLRERDADLQTLRAQFAMLTQQHAALEARCTAQAQKIRDNDGEVKRQTQAITSRVEKLQAQMSLMTQEKESAVRAAGDAEVELTQLRHDMHAMTAKTMKQVEIARHEARMDCETLVKDKDRVLRVREEQLHQDCVRLETRLLEVGAELSRAREAQQNFELKLEDANRVTARKDLQVEQLQTHLADAKRQIVQLQLQVNQEQEFHRQAKEANERSSSAVGLSLQRDLERRTHDLEAAEQKLASTKHQHEQELRRRAAEHDEVVRVLEEKLRAGNERLRVVEGREADAQAECERHRKRSADYKKEAATAETSVQLQQDRVQDLERTLARKEVDMARLHGDVQRLLSDLQEKNKEVEVLRCEFERRDWQDRMQHDDRLSGRLKDWRTASQQRMSSAEHQAALQGERSQSVRSAAVGLVNNSSAPYENATAASNNNNGGIENVSTVILQGTPAVYRQQQQGNHPSTLASDILQEIRSQLVNQSSGYGRSLSVKNNSGAAASGSSVVEVALLREQHELEKIELERKLAEASRVAERHRRRAERLVEEQRLSATAAGAIAAIPAVHATSAAGGEEQHLNVSSEHALGRSVAVSTAAAPTASMAAHQHRMPPPMPASSVRSSSPHEHGASEIRSLQQQFASPLAMKATAVHDNGMQSAQRPWRP